jgi:hypothetical protein
VEVRDCARCGRDRKNTYLGNNCARVIHVKYVAFAGFVLRRWHPTFLSQALLYGRRELRGSIKIKNRGSANNNGIRDTVTYLGSLKTTLLALAGVLLNVGNHLNRVL